METCGTVEKILMHFVKKVWTAYRSLFRRESVPVVQSLTKVE
jgi:hypothetical protein